MNIIRSRSGWVWLAVIALVVASLSGVSVSIAGGTRAPKSAGEDWTWQNPLPTGNCLNAVTAVDGNTAWAAGKYGTIIATRDGINWTPQDSCTDEHIYDIEAANASVAWAIGGNGLILKTDDGGITWNRQASGVEDSLGGICVIDANNVWICAGKNILKTVDGGSHWTLKPVTGCLYSLSDVTTLDNMNAWAVGSQNIFHTADGGNTWTEQTSPISTSYYSVSAADANTAFIVGYPYGDMYSESAAILSTTDGGGTWTAWANGYTRCFYVVDAVDAKTAWTVGANGYNTYVMKTVDGTSWQTEFSLTDTDYALLGISAVNASIAWAVGEGGDIRKTIDGGTTWVSQVKGVIKPIRDIACTDSATAWAAAGGGAIIKTVNGGTTWQKQVSGTTVGLSGLTMIDASNAFVAGNGGMILKTVDGGTTWEKLASGTSNNLYDIEATDKNTAWAVGEYGTILKTINSGATWEKQISGTSFNLCGITAVDSNNIWVVGGTYSGTYDMFGDGIILHTTNGGADWAAQGSSMPFMEEIAAFNADTAYACGLGGEFERTFDGGNTWESMYVGVPFSVYGLAVTGKTNIWMVGSQIWKSTDGGDTWATQEPFMDNSLYCIAAVNDKVAWVGGAYGTILHTTSGGGACSTYCFAEGYTGAGSFDEYLCLMNPGNAVTTAHITYMFTDGTTQTQDVEVGATTRATVKVNDAVGNDRDVSLKVEGDSLIVAERPMYFNYGGAWTGGHDVVGAPVPATRAYFAEGYTGAGQFDEWLCLMNPNPNATVAHITYMFTDGTTQTQDVPVGATTRATVKVNDVVGPDRDVSIMVRADNPIVAERPMYFNYNGVWTGGHDVVGTSNPMFNFFFAEGYTGAGQFDEWLCLMNPNAKATTAQITYMFTDGTTQTQDVEIGATTRATVKVNDVVGPDRDVSIMVHSEDPIVAERPMYFNYNSIWTGGHDVIGAIMPGTIFLFAEGYTGAGSFDEYLCLMNPNTSATTAHITYMFTDGTTQNQDVEIGATTRATVKVNDVVGPDRDVSIKILADDPIVAERPTYFNYGGAWTGGHDVIGYTP